MNIDNLNDKQKEAVLYINGPMLVLAGAGSGKTKVLTNRIANLIDNGISPANILAITFTNKAAKEMKDRVFNLIGNDAYMIQISTFHSLGLKILKENYEKLGYDKNFVVIDSDDALTVIKKIMKDMNLSPQYYNAKNIRNKISSAKNELMDLQSFANLEYDKNIVKIYEKYLEKLKLNNSVDFDDLLILPIRLFREYPSVLESYQERYKYILIDEYQDTNECQYIFSKMLAKKYKNIFVVGDNDQAIYAFRGANYKNILNFEKDYPDCKTILLEENYRSTKTILNAANSVIKNNKLRKDKNLWSNNEEGELIKYIRTDGEKEEADYVAKEIKKLISEGVNPVDIAVLYRTNAQSRVMEEACLKNNIPYKIIGSFYFYNRKEIKDLICYLRLINNYKDDVSLLRVINVPKRKIGEKTIDNISNVALVNNSCLFDAINSGKELEFKNLILDLKEKCENLSLTEMVELVLDKSGMKQELENEKSLDSEIRLENLEEFKSITKNYEEEYGVISLDDFLNEISLVSDMSEHQDGNNKVSLMTVHSVKGLEFDDVFVIGMEEGIFPHYNAINEGTNSAIEEERRLCYVAITRAKKKLWLLNAKKRMLFGNTQVNPPSRFMDEIDSKYVDSEKRTTSLVGSVKKIVKENMFNNDDTDFNVGDMIHHTDYGNGIVTAVDKSIITVAFPHPFGIKKLMKKHKSISKVTVG
ncbi:MAG: UvrD-helicase domain-containing protein [Bacilli bacterium]|nr:UvrD-helicase domain-containing protein [Bacilli bacterium]